jgi:putative transcriptional regulator
MTTRKQTYGSPLSEAIHETATGLHRAGVLDHTTMRRFDASCLVKVEPLAPEDILRLRVRAGVSQSVFALALNVKPKAVSEWERGEKRPSGTALKLLSLVRQKGFEAIL